MKDGDDEKEKMVEEHMRVMHEGKSAKTSADVEVDTYMYNTDSSSCGFTTILPSSFEFQIACSRLFPQDYIDQRLN